MQRSLKKLLGKYAWQVVKIEKERGVLFFKHKGKGVFGF
jgi:hypothetical protein